MLNIKDLNKAEVLKALYDHTHVQGMGFMQAVPDSFVTVEHCEELLRETTYFDYLYGKVLKVDLSGDEFDERLYDRDNGPGAARRAIATLLKGSVDWSVSFDIVNMDIRIREDFETRTVTIRGKNTDSLDKLIDCLELTRHKISGGQYV